MNANNQKWSEDKFNYLVSMLTTLNESDGGRHLNPDLLMEMRIEIGTVLASFANSLEMLADMGDLTLDFLNKISKNIESFQVFTDVIPKLKEIGLYEIVRDLEDLYALIENLPNFKNI